MNKTPEDEETREQPRKPLRKRQTEQPVDLNSPPRGWDVKAESRGSRLEVAARLQVEKSKSDHELRKDFALFLVVLGIVVAATLASLFIVLSNRYPLNIQNAAMALLAAIVSGGVGYATGKSSK